MASDVRLYRLGADPEFLFVKLADGVPYLTNANTVICGNEGKAITSFIGTDNHAATAELRPSPANNIHRIIMDVAHGMSYTGDWLAKKRRFQDLRIIAQPYVCDEPLGGHIHTSMFVRDPDLVAIRAANQIYRGYHCITYDKSYQTHSLSDALVSKLHDRGLTDTMFTPDQYVRVMEWLLGPFERWFQNWGMRYQRNAKYGPSAGDPYRVNITVPPPGIAARFADSCYFHFEYRVPSSWLTHPLIACAYLGLAKLTMLNYDHILKLVTSPVKKKEKATTTAQLLGLSATAWGDMPIAASPPVPDNETERKLFHERLKKLFMDHSPRVTSDIDDLARVLAKIETMRDKWVSPTSTADLPAWKALV